MSQLLARIMLAFFVLPMGCLVYLITFVTCEDWLDRSFRFDWQTESRIRLGFSGVVTWVVVAVWWFLVWRKSVKWNAIRIGFTIACAAVAAVIALMIAAVIDGTNRAWGSFIGSMAAPFFWLVGTIFLWRETSAERAARVDQSGRDSIVCPTCGYNLTGLKESRCPECGTQFTLDQLMASQPARVQGEIEG